MTDLERIFEKIQIEIQEHKLPIFTGGQVIAFLERLMFFYRRERDQKDNQEAHRNETFN